MDGCAVGVAPELPEVRGPGVGPLDRPPGAEGDRCLLRRPEVARGRHVGMTSSTPRLSSAWRTKATSSRVSPMFSSSAQRASSATVSTTPTTIHSSRLARTVVSEALAPQSRSASSHEQPVTDRTSITSEQSRSGSRRRWQPRGRVFGARGTRGSIAARTVSATSGSSACSIVGTSTWSSVGSPAPRAARGHPHDRWTAAGPCGEVLDRAGPTQGGPARPTAGLAGRAGRVRQ